MNQNVDSNGGGKDADAKNERTAFNEGNQDNNAKFNEDKNKNDDPNGKRITNQDQDVTNADDQQDTTEDASANLSHENLKPGQEKGIRRDDGSPEINTPVYEPEETEKKVPKMNENL